MVKLTRLDGSEFTINANLIEIVEANPDTVITLISNKKFMVRETPEEVIKKVVAHYQEAGGPRLIVYTDHACYSQEHKAS